MSFCSTFHLLPLFLFHLNFYINFLLFHFHPSPLVLPSCPQLSLSLSLSLSPILFLIWSIFYYFNHLFFPLIVLFVIVDLIVTSHLFLFLINLYRILCIFRYFSIPILHHKFFFFIPVVRFDMG